MFFFPKEDKKSISKRYGAVSFSNFHEILHLCFEIDFSIKASSSDTFSSSETKHIHTLSLVGMLLFSWLSFSLCFCLHFSKRSSFLSLFRFAFNGCDSTSWCYLKQTKLAYSVRFHWCSVVTRVVCTLMPRKGAKIKRFVFLFVQVMRKSRFHLQGIRFFPSKTSKGILHSLQYWKLYNIPVVAFIVGKFMLDSEALLFALWLISSNLKLGSFDEIKSSNDLQLTTLGLFFCNYWIFSSIL